MFAPNDISKLGFGCMRFIGHEDDTVDIEATCKMIDAYIEAGGNYFDTAWAYPNSEKTLHDVLVTRYPRDSYYLASKCIAWAHCNGPEDLEKQLQESLASLGTDYLDVYLMHNLGGTRTEPFARHHTWEFMKSAKERGLVRHIGFSSHGTPEELASFIETYPDAEIIQLQVNYSDWENPSWRERECVDIARSHGIPVVVMEPVKGGILADPPEAVKAVLDAGMPNDSYSTAALRFAANVDGVLTVLSGMKTLEMVQENCKALCDFKPLTDEEQAVMKAAQEAMSACDLIQCTGCNYCAKVCPQGIGISGSINALNYYLNHKDAAAANHQLGFVVFFNQGKKLPHECIKCGACESACPQNIPIIECLERIQTEIMPFSNPMEKLMKE